MKLAIILIIVLLCAGCVSNVQHIYVYGMPQGSDCKMLVIGAQLAAKPVDLGILNPTAAASQNGDVRQAVELDKK